MPNKASSKAVVYIPKLKNPIAIPIKPFVNRLTMKIRIAIIKIVVILVLCFKFDGSKYESASRTSPLSNPAKYI